MEIKDLATAIELDSEMADVRGGTLKRGRSAGFSFDLDVIKVGNNDVYQTGTNQAQLTFGSIYADTNVYANKSVGGQFNGIGSVNSYAPTVNLNQSNSNQNSNWQTFSGFGITS